MQGETAETGGAEGFPLKAVWFTIALGFLVPFAVRLATAEYYARQLGFAALGEPLRDLWNRDLVLVGLLNAMPFAVFAIWAYWWLGPDRGLSAEARVRRTGGLVGAGAVTLGLSLSTHLGVWSGVFAPGSRPTDGSGSLGRLLLYTLALMPVGYAAGWYAGKRLRPPA